MSDLLSEANNLASYTSRLRRDFHMHPELGFEEVRTSQIVAKELNQLGLEVTTGIAKTGVVALLEGEKPGPVVMLRFDMDALPVSEQTGANYASQHEGKMHACGHDGHVAIGLTVARLLHQHRHQLAGTVKFIFQPAEEGLGGAEGMISEGVLENPRPEVCFGVHVWNEQPIDWVEISSGPLMASGEMFNVKITGKGGHGALPQSTVDPVVAAAHIISALQTIVSRNLSPFSAAVVSVTTVKAGDAFNVIPQEAELTGTIRTFEPEVRQRLVERFTFIVEGVAAAMGCQAKINIHTITPAVVNDPEVTAQMIKVISAAFPNLEIATSYRVMGSEDMAFFMQKVPGVFFLVGSANFEAGLSYSHHHPKFDFDEAVLPKAAAIVAAAAMHYLK